MGSPHDVLHFCTDLGIVNPMTNARPLRVPIAEAAKRGVSWLSETAGERRILLTRFGRVASVVDSAQRLDDTIAKIDVAARSITDHFAEVSRERVGAHSLEDVCGKLDLDLSRVRARADELRS